MNTIEQWAVILAIFIPVAVLFGLWQALVTEPKQREREARRKAWQERQQEYDPELRYGAYHRALRRKYAKVITAGDGVCTERICIMPSRRIEPGAYWHLAHDHQKGGAADYLGPAHPECNENEAMARGVTWDASRSDAWSSRSRSVDDPWGEPSPGSWDSEPPEDPWADVSDAPSLPTHESGTRGRPVNEDRYGTAFDPWSPWGDDEPPF